MRAKAEMAGPSGKPSQASWTRVSKGKLLRKGSASHGKDFGYCSKRDTKPMETYLINVSRRSVSVLDA